MRKIAFMFPGQGAQYIGMAKDFYDAYPVSREAFETASRITGLNLESLCFEENEKIHITEYTQIAMLAAEIAILRVVEEQGVGSDVNIGLSLGEYGALVACGALSYEDACHVVRQRGIFMEKEVPAGQGAMSAVLGMPAEQIEGVLAQVGEKLGSRELLGIANYNCPGQIVISGESKAIALAQAALQEAGAKRVIPLQVSGPFHSAMLKGAGDKLKAVLEQVEIRDFSTPYVANYNAAFITEKEQVKPLLEKQVYSSVRFWQSVELLLEQGVDTFIEIGPGKTLTGFIRKINRQVCAINIEKTEDLEKLKTIA